MWFRVEVEGLTHAKAWFDVFPGATCSAKSAKEQCSRFLKWYVQHFPPTFDEVAASMGMGPLFVMTAIKRLMTATKWNWDAKKQKRVPTQEPDTSAQSAGTAHLLRLIEKSEKWRRAFLERDKARPPEMIEVPQFETVQEFEEWAQANDPFAGIEASRKAATEERDRRLAEQGRLPMPPRNGSTP